VPGSMHGDGPANVAVPNVDDARDEKGKGQRCRGYRGRLEVLDDGWPAEGLRADEVRPILAGKQRRMGRKRREDAEEVGRPWVSGIRWRWWGADGFWLVVRTSARVI
jgi:hypothetical protein